MANSASERSNWFQVGLAALSQNFATGMAFGGFGTMLLSVESEYHASRSQSSLLLSLLVVSLSLTAAFLGRKLERWPIRPVMIAGALLGAGGFMLASLVDGIYPLLAVFLLVLGPATAMFGVLPSMTLASRWAAPARQGLAMGIVNMPVMVMLVPLSIAPILEAYDVRNAFRALALAELLVALALMLVRERPVANGGEPGVALAEAAGDVGEAATKHETQAMLRSGILWLIVLAIGLIVGAGAMKITHMIPLLMEQGRTFDQANLLLALSGGAGLIGSFTFGWLADRIGGCRTLMLNALLQAGMWTIFLFKVPMALLVADALVVGACGGGAQAAFGAALIALFGKRAFSNALGLVSLLTIPFLFGISPVVSLVYEASGTYHIAMSMMVVGFLLAILALWHPARVERRSGANALEGSAT